jgi:hypothetical protein
MLKKILSVSGKQGLYKLISQGKNMFIVESLIDQKRISVFMHNKSVSLGDIAIYTQTEDVPLWKVLSKIKEKEEGKEIIFNPSTIQPDELRAYFETVLPDFDKDKVYLSDIKKIMSWYNLLIKSGLTDFEQEEEGKTKDDETKTDETIDEKNKIN